MTKGFSVIIATALAISVPAFAQDMATSTVALSGADGADHGTVELRQTPSGVLLTAKLTNIPAGIHGFHIHETGACDAADGFRSAGGHYAGMNDTHGLMAEGGPHSGDMPNIHVPESGSLDIEIYNANISLKDGEENSLFDDDGSAIVIHAGADDYESQPSGEAGDRIACGIVEAQ